MTDAERKTPMDAIDQAIEIERALRERIKQLESENTAFLEGSAEWEERTLLAERKIKQLEEENLKMLDSLKYINQRIGKEVFSDSDRFGAVLNSVYTCSRHSLEKTSHTAQLVREREADLAVIEALKSYMGRFPSWNSTELDSLKEALAARDKVYAEGK